MNDLHEKQLAAIEALLSALRARGFPIWVEAACLQLALVRVLAEAGHSGAEVEAMLTGAAQMARLQLDGVPMTGGGPEGVA